MTFFIVGELHQRIYDRRSSLSKVGIDIVGRSKKLKINYRTTRQKLRWSLAALGEGDHDDVDDSANRQGIAGYTASSMVLSRIAWARVRRRPSVVRRDTASSRVRGRRSPWAHHGHT